MKLINQLREIPFDRQFASLMLIVMSTQFVFIEGYTVSVIKVGIMSISAIMLFWNGKYVNKAVITGGLYWLICFFTSIFNPNFRFYTLGYLGMFLLSYMLFYKYLYIGTFSLLEFKRLLRFLILAFLVSLILQQISVLLGFLNVPLLNLGISQDLGHKAYYAWNRLPTLTCEPSHSGVILAGLMLGYVRIIEIEKDGQKTTIKDLFNKCNRLVAISYIYLIVFMGSATGFIGLGIVCLYFVRLKSFMYVVPIFAMVFVGFQNSDNKQLKRAVAAVSATLTMDQKNIRKADGSGAVRIVPLINTVKSDYSDKEVWFGKGTAKRIADEDENEWVKTFNKKIATVEQYGLLALIASIIFVYSCCIFSVFSLETLFFIVLLLCTVGNVYCTWSVLYVFTAIRYFKENTQIVNFDGCIDSNSKL